jgi:hypothetical protein
MPPSDDLFYARLLTLSNAELFTYIHHYTDYKVDAVQAALAEVHTRGLYVSEAVLADIERYLMRHEQQRMRPCNRDPRHLRWLAFAIVIIGLGSAMFLLTSCKNFEICRIGSVAAIIYGFKLCFSAFLLSGGQASEYPHLASCSSRAQLRSQF